MRMINSYLLSFTPFCYANKTYRLGFYFYSPVSGVKTPYDMSVWLLSCYNSKELYPLEAGKKNKRHNASMALPEVRSALINDAIIYPPVSKALHNPSAIGSVNVSYTESDKYYCGEIQHLYSSLLLNEAIKQMGYSVGSNVVDALLPTVSTLAQGISNSVLEKLLAAFTLNTGDTINSITGSVRMGEGSLNEKNEAFHYLINYNGGFIQQLSDSSAPGKFAELVDTDVLSSLIEPLFNVSLGDLMPVKHNYINVMFQALGSAYSVYSGSIADYTKSLKISKTLDVSQQSADGGKRSYTVSGELFNFSEVTQLPEINDVLLTALLRSDLVKDASPTFIASLEDCTPCKDATVDDSLIKSVLYNAANNVVNIVENAFFKIIREGNSLLVNKGVLQRLIDSTLVESDHIKDIYLPAVKISDHAISQKLFIDNEAAINKPETSLGILLANVATYEPEILNNATSYDSIINESEVSDNVTMYDSTASESEVSKNTTIYDSIVHQLAISLGILFPHVTITEPGVSKNGTAHDSCTNEPETSLGIVSSNVIIGKPETSLGILSLNVVINKPDASLGVLSLNVVTIEPEVSEDVTVYDSSINEPENSGSAMVYDSSIDGPETSKDVAVYDSSINEPEAYKEIAVCDSSINKPEISENVTPYDGSADRPEVSENTTAYDGSVNEPETSLGILSLNVVTEGLGISKNATAYDGRINSVSWWEAYPYVKGVLDDIISESVISDSSVALIDSLYNASVQVLLKAGLTLLSDTTINSTHDAAPDKLMNSTIQRYFNSEMDDSDLGRLWDIDLAENDSDIAGATRDEIINAASLFRGIDGSILPRTFDAYFSTEFDFADIRDTVIESAVAKGPDLSKHLTVDYKAVLIKGVKSIHLDFIDAGLLGDFDEAAIFNLYTDTTKDNLNSALKLYQDSFMESKEFELSSPLAHYASSNLEVSAHSKLLVHDVSAMIALQSLVSRLTAIREIEKSEAMNANIIEPEFTVTNTDLETCSTPNKVYDGGVIKLTNSSRVMNVIKSAIELPLKGLSLIKDAVTSVMDVFSRNKKRMRIDEGINGNMPDDKPPQPKKKIWLQQGKSQSWHIWPRRKTR